jgi:hypothetical protein
MYFINEGSIAQIPGVWKRQLLIFRIVSTELLRGSWDPEPLPEGHPIYGHPGIRLTPHTSGQTERFEDLLTAKIFANLDRFLAGQPLIDQVDPQKGY